MVASGKEESRTCRREREPGSGVLRSPCPISKPGAGRENPLPLFPGLEETTLIQAQCKGDDGLIYLDVSKSMLDDDGMPKKELFVNDGLHLTDEGYKLWASLLKPYLKRE